MVDLPTNSHSHSHPTEPEGLITTRKKNYQEANAYMNAERQKYIDQPAKDEDFQVTGYYLWPSKSETAMDLLGFQLQDLNPTRIEHKVWIEWQEQSRCLKIRSDSIKHGEQNISAAIKGIRLAVKNAKARAISASPLYIVIPPTTNAMRHMVCPKTVDGNRASFTGLAGKKLTAAEKSRWETQRLAMVLSNEKKFEEHLLKSLSDLAQFKGRMRMRVHYGHVVFSQFRQDFADGKFTLEKFIHMMGLSRTTAHLDRKLDDAALAMNLKQSILDSPLTFRPLEGQIQGLEDVAFKDTEIVFVIMPDGQNLRIEGDVDKIQEGTTAEYQIGSVKPFYDNQRNKRVEIMALDIERPLDFSLEIISDNSITNPAEALLSFVQESVSVKSAIRVDPLGLNYVQVSPQAPYGITVSGVVVRSVIQYMMEDSGYVVEIAIYRRWEDSNTRTEPKMAASVSMFHRDWDFEMESIEGTTKERVWEVRNFFGNDIRKFLSHVNAIQSMISTSHAV